MTSYVYSGASAPPTKATVRPVFIPPRFGNLAKNAKDLFGAKFNYGHALRTVHRSPGGVVFESGVQAGAFPLRGYVRSTVASTYGYTVEAEANTDAAADTKATIRSSSLYPGLSVGATALSNASGVTYTGDAEYVRDAMTATAELRSDLSKHAAKLSFSAGYDGIAVGGLLAADLTSGAEVTDYNVGVEYLQPTYVASVYTENQAETATVSYYQRLSTQHAIGAQAKIAIAGDKSAVLSIGDDFVIDAQTAVKGKVEVPTAVVSVALEHRLKNPNVMLSIAGQYSPLTFQKQVSAPLSPQPHSPTTTHSAHSPQHSAVLLTLLCAHSVCAASACEGQS